MQMQNDFKLVQSIIIVDFESDIFNKHAQYVCHYKTTPPFTDTSVKNRLWQLLLRCDNIVLFSSWNLCSGKPSPEALTKQHSQPDSDHLTPHTSVSKSVNRYVSVSILHYELVKPQSDERQKPADKIGRFLSPDKNRPIFVSHDRRFLLADKMRENGFVRWRRSNRVYFSVFIKAQKTT